jgi:hypothetical protein
MKMAANFMEFHTRGCGFTSNLNRLFVLFGMKKGLAPKSKVSFIPPGRDWINNT